MALWLNYRSFHEMPWLPDVYDFITVNSQLHHEHDQFKQAEVKLSHSFVPLNDLLKFYCLSQSSHLLNCCKVVKMGRPTLICTSLRLTNTCRSCGLTRWGTVIMALVVKGSFHNLVHFWSSSLESVQVLTHHLCVTESLPINMPQLGHPSQQNDQTYTRFTVDGESVVSTYCVVNQILLTFPKIILSG